MSNIIRAIFHNVNDKEVFVKARYQYDYGMVLRFEGAVTLPSAYEVHFALARHGEAITQIGNSEGVSVPDALFLAGKTIYAWAYLHSGEDDGYTEYMVQIPVIKRAQPSDEVPTPVQQSAIDQAIAALGVAVEQTAADVETTTANAESAQASEEAAAASAAEAAETAENVEENVTAARAAKAAAELARDRAVQAETSANQSKTAAATSEANAAASATAASASAAAALTSEENANGAMMSAYSDANRADTAADTATSAKNDAVSAKTAAQSAKTAAETAASTATTKASEAAASATTASTAASTATTKAGEAATSATNAAASAQSVASSAAQITQNAEDIDALKEDLTAVESVVTYGNVFDSASVITGYKVAGSAGQIFSTVEDANACYYVVPTPVKGVGGTITFNLVNFPSYYMGDSVGLLVRQSDGKIYTPIYGHRTPLDTISFTGSWAETNTDMMLYLNCTVADKDNYAVFVNDIENNFAPFGRASLSLKNSPLYGKKLCCNGDSIMYGAGATGGFAKIIADMYGMNLQNIAISGGTVASGTTDSGTNRHWIAEAMSSLDADGDYYIIEGGVNDYSLSVPLFASGQSSVRTNIKTTYPDDVTIFTEAMEAICYDLIVNHTAKKVGFVLPHKISWLDWSSNSLGLTYMQYKNAQKEILKKWGIPFIDLSEISGMNTVINAIASAYTANSDRTHPNYAGYNTFYVPHIIKWMEKL